MAESVPVEIDVLIVVGKEPPEAHVAVRGTNSSLVVPAGRIADDAGIPVNELPGRRFRAVMTMGEDSTDLADFALVNDPRV